MKKLVSLGLAFLLMFGMLSLTACAKTEAPAAPAATTAAPTTPAAPAASTAPAAPAATPVDNTVYTLIASTHTPATTTMSTVFKNMLEEITARSNGRLKFDVYTDGTLAAADGILDAIESGIADVAAVNYSRLGGRMNLVGVMSLPGICNNPWEGTMAFLDLYDKSQPVQQEFKSVGLIPMGVAMGTGFTVISKTPITDISDLAGKRVIIPSNSIAGIITALKATPLGFSNTESYEALSKGTADAMVSNTISGAVGFGIHEVAKNVFDMNFGIGPMLFCIGEKAYNELPADLQKIINDVRRDFVPDNVYTVYVLEKGKEKTALKTFQEAGVNIVMPTKEQVADFQTKYASVAWNAWVADLKTKGLDSQAVLDEYVALNKVRAGTVPDFK